MRGRRNGISEGSQYQIRHACVRPRRAPRDLCDRERPHAGRLGGEAHPRLRLELRAYLERQKQRGKIRDYIPGERFSIFDEATRRAFAHCDELRRDRDLEASNNGMTVVIL